MAKIFLVLVVQRSERAKEPQQGNLLANALTMPESNLPYQQPSHSHFPAEEFGNC